MVILFGTGGRPPWPLLSTHQRDTVEASRSQAQTGGIDHLINDN